MNKVESDYEEILIVDYFCNNEKEKIMKTVMRKKRFLTISGIACILLLTLAWQSAFGCWDTWESGCSDYCWNLTPEEQLEHGYASFFRDGLGGYTCHCHEWPFPKYSSCDEEVIGDCWDYYYCSQLDCEGTCVYKSTVDKRRCLVEE